MDFNNFKQQKKPIAQVSISSADLAFLIDTITNLKNEQQILLMRNKTLEKLFKWAMQFITFFQSISTFIFHNNLPISSVIFNTDLMQIPFDLYTLFDNAIKDWSNTQQDVYSHYSILKKIDPNISPPNFADNKPKTWPARFEHSEMNKWLEKLRTSYDTFVVDYTTKEYVFLSIFDQLAKDEQDKLIDGMRRVLKETSIGDKFSPHYLLQQTAISQILMTFASSIFHYIPQLKIDLTSHPTFSIGNYLDNLKNFWDTQVNCVIEGYHFRLNPENFPEKKTSADILNEFRDYLHATNNDWAALDQGLQLYLWRLEKKNYDPPYLSDPDQLSMSWLWREKFLEVFKPQDPKSFVSLYETILEQFRATNIMSFNKVFLELKLQLIEKPSYLLGLRLTLWEQNVILRNIIKMLIQQYYLYRQENTPPFACSNNPLTALARELNNRDFFIKKA